MADYRGSSERCGQWGGSLHGSGASESCRSARGTYLASPAVGQNGGFCDHDDAVEHFPILTGDPLDLRRVADDLCSGANVTVLIDDRVFDHGAVANADGGST